MTFSCFGLVANETAIDTGQFDRLRIISLKALREALNCDINDQAGGVAIP
jgi:hypothetical protein